MRRVVFMGTPDFAVPTLTILHEAGYEVVGVFTQPDRPKGRGQKLSLSPVKECAISYDLPVYQPEKIKTAESVELLRSLRPDVIIVVAYGQILSEEILSLPTYGCINVHASLLPKYRGAAPIHWAIINGESLTGVTTMHMDRGLDTGDMILKAEMPIDADDTTGTMHHKLAILGAKVLLETLRQLEAGTAPRMPQDDTEATYASLLNRGHEVIQWDRSARDVWNQIRGLNPWPGAFTTYQERILKVWRAVLVDEGVQHKPGTIIALDKDGFTVATGTGTIKLLEVQPQNSKRMSAADFARGHHLEAGERIGVL